ncbi:MAG: hypothetical protein M3162_08145 [Thermoproteota archaeon]|nr:hypothetical protein [Thermoproteota archaeon]
MTLFEIPFWRKWGITGILEWHENQILTTRFLNSFSKDGRGKRKGDPDPDQDRAVIHVGIFFLHFVNGMLAAIVFPFAYPVFSPFFTGYEFAFSIGSGVIYGLLLWILTLVPIHKPITGLSIWDHPLGNGPAIVSFSGHVVYGVALGTCIYILL